MGQAESSPQASREPPVVPARLPAAPSRPPPHRRVRGLNSCRAVSLRAHGGFGRAKSAAVLRGPARPPRNVWHAASLAGRSSAAQPARRLPSTTQARKNAGQRPAVRLSRLPAVRQSGNPAGYAWADRGLQSKRPAARAVKGATLTSPKDPTRVSVSSAATYL